MDSACPARTVALGPCWASGGGGGGDGGGVLTAEDPPLLLHCPVAGARGPHRAWPPRGQTARLQDASLCFSEPKLQTLGLVTGFLNTNLRMY